jgi:hypothetical protein
MTTGSAGGVTGIVPPSGGDVAPGAPVYDLARKGQGPCAGGSLEQAISAVHKGWSHLSDIQMLYTPDQLGDGSFIRAFASESSFALDFKRGGGDCPSGCTENEHWYFMTDVACAPTQVGHFKAAWATGNCLSTEGTPMWGLPKPPDPAVVCGADNSPRDVSGVHNLRGTGTRMACTDKGAGEPRVNVNVPLTMTVAQSTGDLSRGTVTLQGSGYPLIDGQPIAAMFSRRRFTATREVSNLPATCIDQHAIQLDLDFDSGLPGHLEFTETRSLNCPPSQDYCKGQLNLDLAILP